MLILHLAYEQNSIYLWGRRSPSTGCAVRSPARTDTRRCRGARSPRSCAPRSRRRACGTRARPTSSRRTYTYCCPRRTASPAPSDGILGDAPQPAGEAKLEIFRVPALPVEFAEFARDAAHDARVRRKDTGPRNNPRRRFQIPLPRARVRGGARAARGPTFPTWSRSLRPTPRSGGPSYSRNIRTNSRPSRKAMPPVLCGVFLDEPQEDSAPPSARTRC